MEDQSSRRESSSKTKSSSVTANGPRNEPEVSLKPGVEAETYNKVHHDLDVAAAHRKPIVTESKYKVKVAEPGVETLPLADHDHVEGHVDRKSEKTVEKSSKTTTSTTEGKKEKPKAKGQFIAKPDVYGEGGAKGDKDGGFSWLPVVGGVAAIAGVVAGAVFYKKRNPDVDVNVRRSVRDADQRVKGAIGSGERKVKELIGSGQQKFSNLIHRGEHDVSEDEGPDSRGLGHNALNVFGGGGDYQVKQGDNLTKIARKSGKKNWHEIADKNPSIRNPDLIYPGDRLKL
jgi:nucleoid-associated protein YgaU